MHKKLLHSGSMLYVTIHEKSSLKLIGCFCIIIKKTVCIKRSFFSVRLIILWIASLFARKIPTNAKINIEGNCPLKLTNKERQKYTYIKCNSLSRNSVWGVYITKVYSSYFVYNSVLSNIVIGIVN